MIRSNPVSSAICQTIRTLGLEKLREVAFLTLQGYQIEKNKNERMPSVLKTPTITSSQLKKDIGKLASPEIAKHAQGFFKTAKGEYGYGDRFLGVRTPEIRKLAKKYIGLSLGEVLILVKSEFHEERLCGLVIMVNKYAKAKEKKEQQVIFNQYIKHFKYVNNWDLVDVTCPHIVGRHLFEKDRKILYQWAKSKHLWTRRISIISNLWFIRNGDLKDVFKISKILLNDKHDLIHKAVGWMLREAGKKDLKKLESFLMEHYQNMPRTMLRYSIEKFPKTKRDKYLKGA